jgi:pimeloyl-ACP methyl ester carboxylesterase
MITQRGRGMARSSFIARLFVALAGLPVLGDTVMRMRQFLIMKSVLNGGVADRKRIPPEQLKEMYLVGNRDGHYRAFLNLLRNAETWETATMTYSTIRIPVLQLWGDRNRSRPDEREHDPQIVPNAKMGTVEHEGHFLPLDRPSAVIEHLLAFRARLLRGLCDEGLPFDATCISTHFSGASASDGGRPAPISRGNQ